MNISRIIFLITMLLIPHQAFTASGDEAPVISVSVGELYYRIGGGKVIPPPGAGYRSFNIRARLRAGLGYSCGQFDFQDNIAQMVNQFKTRARQLPGQLQTAVQAAIAGLPGYLVLKYNPTLYNILTKTLDESADLFKLSFKSCEAMQAEMGKNPKANPYDSFLRASMLDEWKIGAESNNNIADLDETIKSSPGKTIAWFDGQQAGSSNNPLEMNKDVVIAGYNLMIGRTSTLTSITKPTGAMALEPVAQIWETPAQAGDWIQNVVGENRVVLNNPLNNPETNPGNGLRPEVDLLDTKIHAALKKAFDENNYQDLNKFTTTRIAGVLIDGLRQLPPGEAILMIDRLASEMAINEAQERVFLIIQMMEKALNSPDIQVSPGGDTATEYIRGVTYPTLEAMLNQIHSDLSLKQKTVNKTTISILNLAERKRREGTRGQPGAIQSERPFVGGGVKQ